MAVTEVGKTLVRSELSTSAFNSVASSYSRAVLAFISFAFCVTDSLQWVLTGIFCFGLLRTVYELSMPATMKTIARDLGVSVVTVSKVLHNHTDISQETRKRVLRRMKEVNYQPNLAARALSTGRTSLIGLIVPDLVHPFFAQVAKGISARLSSQGYSLIISSSEENPQLERREIDQMLARRVDALLLASTENNPDSLEKLKNHSLPFVLLDRKI